MPVAMATVAAMIDFQTKAAERSVGAIPADGWLQRPGGGSHAYWILGHLATYRRILLRHTGGSTDELPWESAFRGGTQPGEAIADPTPEALLVDLQATGKQLLDALPKLTAADLAADAPRPFPIGKTLADMITFMGIFHESYHIGQLSTLGKALAE